MLSFFIVSLAFFLATLAASLTTEKVYLNLFPDMPLLSQRVWKFVTFFVFAIFASWVSTGYSEMLSPVGDLIAIVTGIVLALLIGEFAFKAESKEKDIL
jgi:fructose-specific phosphotransferase system IIC component